MRIMYASMNAFKLLYTESSNALYSFRSLTKLDSGLSMQSRRFLSTVGSAHFASIHQFVLFKHFDVVLDKHIVRP